ncbi:MAG: phosphoribosyl-AMP cyclohydrolase [Opitutales bacterium]|nr:phosphoribosyl-AMP cyclohydrolase [Opitutales bacterium]MCH8540354.1 phosphoribosyl-AMP cyclohydrolase [Opitutales bacterium]
MSPFDPPPDDPEALELGPKLFPRFDADGLLPCIVQDHQSSEVLMFAWMNPEALQMTLEQGKATFWSRSRKKLWTKGESSGRMLEVKEIRIDCDQDVLLLKVQTTAPGVCHQGFRSCFYRKVEDGKSRTLTFAIKERAFDPEKVYRPKLGK